MSAYSRHRHKVRPVVKVMNVDGSPFRVDATTTFAQWMHAWLDAGAAGITDVMTVPDLPPPENKVVVIGYRIPKDASDLADMMAQSLSELVIHGVLPAGDLGSAFPELDYAPSSNTGRTATDRQSQEGEGELIDAAIASLLKLRRDRVSGL